MIQRIGLLQINRMLNFTGDQRRKVIEDVYPDWLRRYRAPAPEQFRSLPLTRTLTHHAGPQVIQALDTAVLVCLAKASGGVIEMLAVVGDTVVYLTPVLRLFGARQLIDEKALTNAIEMGEQRTFEQDPNMPSVCWWISPPRRYRCQ